MYGFGGVSNDHLMTLAINVVEDLNLGHKGAAVQHLKQMDPATRAAACQRAQELLSLPPCASMADPGGSGDVWTCLPPEGDYAHKAAQLSAAMATACQAAGTGPADPTASDEDTILGMQPTTFYIVAGVAAVGLGLLLFLPKK